MSRVAKKPVTVPNGVEVKISERVVHIKGKYGHSDVPVHDFLLVSIVDNELSVSLKEICKDGWVQAGTLRALLNNAVVGVTTGFEKKLQLVGVGYRAQTKGNLLSLTLGYSHPVEFNVPEGIDIQTPTQTEVIIKGMSKHKVGQVAAKIRSFRPPEPYKGKGVRYSDERVLSKEPKKK
jgi:large subunit ribosomal protein L6